MRKIGACVLGLVLVVVIASLAAQSATTPSDRKPATAPSGDLWNELQIPKPASKPTSADAKRLIGTWRHVSPTSWGIIQYDASGYMAVQISTGRVRRPFAGPEPTLEEAKEANRTYQAYWGPFIVDERAHTVTHHRVANARDPGEIGDYVRKYEFLPGDRLALEPVEAHTGGKRMWERIKP